MKISTLWKLQNARLALQFNGELMEDGKKFVSYFKQL